MDPFNEVQADCWAQVQNLKSFIQKTRLITEDSKADFQYSFQDVQETLADLNQAVMISERTPERFELSSSQVEERKQVLRELETSIARLEDDWNSKLKDPHRQREVTTMSNRISQDAEGGAGDSFRDSNEIGDEQFNEYQRQEYIQNQDSQLESIHQTMQNLNQQATMMGSELEDQGFMLEDLDQELDSVGMKLLRGMKRVEYVIEKNRERASDCCIVLLVVALCVLLVLLLVL